MKQILVGAFLVPALICGVTFLVNFISIYYGSSRSIPFTVMVCLKRVTRLIEIRILFFQLVKCNSYLFIYYFTFNCSWNCIRKKYKWKNKLSMSNKCCTTTYSGKEMVYGTTCDYICKWNFTIWFDFYWNVNSFFLRLISSIWILLFRYFIFTSFWAYKVNK